MEFRSGVIANINTSYIWFPACLFGNTALPVSDHTDPGLQNEVRTSAEKHGGYHQRLPMETPWKIHSLFPGHTAYLQYGSEFARQVVDMAKSLVEGRKHRMAAELACHVTEVLSAFGISASQERVVHMTSTYDGMTRLPEGEGIFERLD